MTDVSIIINNYNYGRYVGQAISSALDQHHPGVEVVVVDDGSTDNSRAVIEQFRDRITSVLKPNGGQGSAINAGFAGSTGSSIIFLDADDTITPDAAAVVADRLGRSPKVSKIAWQMVLMGADGRVSNRRYPATPPAEGDLLRPLVEEGPFSFTISPTSGNAWSRGFLKQVLPMPADLFRINADSYLFTLSPIYGLAERVSVPLSHYRIHGDNAYASQSAFDTMDQLAGQHLALLSILHQHLSHKFIEHEPEQWKQGYWEELRILRTSILNAIPPGEAFCLVDDDQLNLGRGFYGRPRRYLMERQGVYWGPPEDGAQAVDQLIEHRSEGVGYIVFTKATFWWIRHYEALRTFLASHGEAVDCSRSHVIYRLI